MYKHTFVLLLFLVATNFFCNAQIVINEIQSSNLSGIVDEDNEYSDWIELYNSSDNDINLAGYILNDKRSDSSGWVFPDITLPSKDFLLVFASGKDRKEVNSKYHTIIKKGENWKFFVPSSSFPEGWRNTNFNDSSWDNGPSGFGFGDNDDATVLNNAQTVLIRKEFDVEDIGSITKMFFHVDYDDGFIAFINGNMVAMGGVSSVNEDYSVVQTEVHEAVMYSNGFPEFFDISEAIYFLQKGKNVLAIQGHNTSSTSTDFSLIPFLTLCSKDYSENDVESFINVDNENLHANFKISKEGESIYLFNSSSEIIDSTKSIEIGDNVSYGRYKDGDSTWYYFQQPTPGSENRNPQENISHDSVYFSADAGLYSQPFELTLQSSSGNGEIHFTTDGSLPTIQSQIYTGGIQISSTTVVRAIIISDTIFKNPIATQTYIFNNSNGLPVVSISSDPKNFFDWYEGILVDGPNYPGPDPHYGANYWQEWEKPVNFEYFDKEGIGRINQGAGIKVSGNWSRMNAQKSLALYARKKYGKGSFKYKFFGDRKNDSFESFTLRNSGNDWSYTMMRDGLFSELAKDMNMERLAYQPAVVYLNGEYWGILNMRERPNEHYFAENFGVDEENLTMMEYNSGESLVFGERTDYSKLVSIFNSKTILSTNDFEKIYGLMDIDCFIDYQLFQIYLDNGDWPGNNNKFWKSSDPLSKWRWLLFDADFGFDLFGSPYEVNTFKFATASNRNDWPNYPWSTLFLRKLLVNENFKNQFVNRLSDCLNSNLFSIAVNAKIDSIQNILDPEIQNHINRWTSTYDNWNNQVQRLRSFAISRKNNLRGYMRDFFKFKLDYVITLTVSDADAGKIKINTIFPSTYPFKGNYFGEVPITLKAIPNPGYRFVRWEKGSTSSEMNIAVSLTSDTKFHAVFEPVSETEFQIVINEINYKSSDESDAGDWIEIYNSGNQTVNLSGWYIQDANSDNSFYFPSGHILYPGEYLVVADDLVKFKNSYPFISNCLGNFNFGLSSSGDLIALYDGNGNLIDKVNYDVQSPWPTEPNGTGKTLELKNPSLNNEQASNWGAGKFGGTPGAKNSVAVSVNVLADVEHEPSCFPTCFTDFTTLRFYCPEKGDYTVQVLDIQGRVIETQSGHCQSAGTYYLDLFTETNNDISGIYLVRVQTMKGVQTVKVMKK